MFIRIRNNFITGIVAVLPVILTVLILRFLILKINLYILSPIMNTLGPYFDKPYLIYLTKTIVFLIVLSLIVLLGMATRVLIFRKSFCFTEQLLFKVPMVGKIYTIIKQLSFAFLGQSKGLFERVVLIEYPRKGLYSVGFVTAKGKGEIQAKTPQDVLSVLVPTTPNPTSGVYLLVPEDESIALDMSVEEGLKVVISGGTIMPPSKNKT